MKLPSTVNQPIELLDYLAIEGILGQPITFHKLKVGSEIKYNISYWLNDDGTSDEDQKYFDSFEEFENYVHKNFTGDTYRLLRQSIKLAKIKFKL